MVTTTKGRSLARLDRGIAEDFGRRLKAARLRAGLTQAKLAEPRYTKAYISALEHGHAKPSMAALNFLSQRLGITATRLLETDAPHWTRLEADLRLASGDWQAAVDAYTTMLDDETHMLGRAALQRGLAEALCRLERPADALVAASDAAATFEEAGQKADAADARYWQASALFQLENDDEARSLLRQLLDDVRAGLMVEPDFGVRLLISLAMVETRAREPGKALGYLDEARALVSGLDEHRRGIFLASLAMNYRATGDYEAAVATGNQALSRFRASEAEREVSRLENELALVHLALGSIGRAREHAESADRILQRVGDDGLRAHVIETEAQIELADGSPERAGSRAVEALALAESSGNHRAAISAGITLARSQRALGQPEAAADTLASAASEARAAGRSAQLRDVLTEWADLLATTGDHAGAYERSREALAIGH
jgi:transcriptional regulator with XRE-family HTH domain